MGIKERAIDGHDDGQRASGCLGHDARPDIARADRGNRLVEGAADSISDSCEPGRLSGRGGELRQECTRLHQPAQLLLS